MSQHAKTMTGNDLFVAHKSKGSRGMGQQSGKDMKHKVRE